MKAFHIWIDDQIFPNQIGQSSISAKYIREQVKLAKEDGAEKLVLHINSLGGSVFEGFAIFNELTRAGLPIESYIEGMSASIATLVMLAGEDNKIFMSPASQLMFHKPMAQTQGNALDHENTIEELEKIERLMAERYAHKMGKPIEAGHELMSKGDFWVNPDEAKALNIIDFVQLPKVAFGKLNEFLLNLNMSKQTDNSFLKTLLAKANKFIAEVIEEGPTAGTIRLADGETIIYFDGETLETGKAVFTDEAMTTPAPEGEHALEDGRLMIVDSAGIVVELREIEASADEKLVEAQARIEALEQENADLKASIEAQKTEATAKLKDAQALVAQLKAQVVSGNSGAQGEHGSNKKKPTASSNVEGGEKFLSAIKEKLSRAKEGKL